MNVPKSACIAEAKSPTDSFQHTEMHSRSMQTQTSRPQIWSYYDVPKYVTALESMPHVRSSANLEEFDSLYEASVF